MALKQESVKTWKCKKCWDTGTIDTGRRGNLRFLSCYVCYAGRKPRAKLKEFLKRKDEASHWRLFSGDTFYSEKEAKESVESFLAVPTR